ncbi:MAG: hypothetical protein ABWK53_01270 [Anaerolineales bacterium]
MSIAIYNQSALVGGVLIESETIGWLYRGAERIGRVEVDWGEEDQEHEATVFVAGNPCAGVTVERYGRSLGRIHRGLSDVGEVRPEGTGVCAIYRDAQKIGRLEAKATGLSMKHLMLFGGAGAAVLLGLCG